MSSETLPIKTSKFNVNVVFLEVLSVQVAPKARFEPPCAFICDCTVAMLILVVVLVLSAEIHSETMSQRITYEQ